MKKLRVLALMHEDLIPPEKPGEGVDLATVEWKTEYDVVTTLRDMGHEVSPLGLRNDLAVIRKAIEERKPQVAFNLLEEFDGFAVYDQNVVSYLELLRIPYTGCNPRGLMLARDKSLAKKVLSYHRIPSPDFFVCPVGEAVKRPKRLEFPLIVNRCPRKPPWVFHKPRSWRMTRSSRSGCPSSIAAWGPAPSWS